MQWNRLPCLYSYIVENYHTHGSEALTPQFWCCAQHILYSFNENRRTKINRIRILIKLWFKSCFWLAIWQIWMNFCNEKRKIFSDPFGCELLCQRIVCTFVLNLSLFTYWVSCSKDFEIQRFANQTVPNTWYDFHMNFENKSNNYRAYHGI